MTNSPVLASLRRALPGMVFRCRVERLCSFSATVAEVTGDDSLRKTALVRRRAGRGRSQPSRPSRSRSREVYRQGLLNLEYSRRRLAPVIPSSAWVDEPLPAIRACGPRRLTPNPSDCKAHEPLDHLEKLPDSEGLALATPVCDFHPRTARTPHGRPARGPGGIRPRGPHPSPPGLGWAAIVARPRRCQGNRLVKDSRRLRKIAIFATLYRQERPHCPVLPSPTIPTRTLIEGEIQMITRDRRSDIGRDEPGPRQPPRVGATDSPNHRRRPWMSGPAIRGDLAPNSSSNERARAGLRSRSVAEAASRTRCQYHPDRPELADSMASITINRINVTDRGVLRLPELEGGAEGPVQRPRAVGRDRPGGSVGRTKSASEPGPIPVGQSEILTFGREMSARSAFSISGDALCGPQSRDEEALPCSASS